MRQAVGFILICYSELSFLAFQVPHTNVQHPSLLSLFRLFPPIKKIKHLKVLHQSEKPRKRSKDKTIKVHLFANFLLWDECSIKLIQDETVQEGTLERDRWKKNKQTREEPRPSKDVCP